MSVSSILAVAAGGALGSVGRYLAMAAVGQWLGTAFPFATMAVNVVGCFVMGALAELAALAWSPAPEVRALVMVGVLGGFTTFSSFALDVGALTGRNAYVEAGMYVLGTLVLTIAGFFAGMALVRSLAGGGLS